MQLRCVLPLLLGLCWGAGACQAEPALGDLDATGPNCAELACGQAGYDAHVVATDANAASADVALPDLDPDAAAPPLAIDAGGATGEGDGKAGQADAADSGGRDAAADASGLMDAASSIPRATFRNPLNASHGSDPWLLYHDGAYYLAATTWGTNLTMKRATTVQALKNEKPSVIWSDPTASRCCNHWAPEFHLLDGPNGRHWYVYYTAGDGKSLDSQRSHVLESAGLDPRGPYHYQARLLDSWAIDGSILRAGSERYFMFSAWAGATQNVYLMRMTNPWTVTGTPVLLSKPDYAWEREGTAAVNEGPEALYHDGRTFVTYSASQCGSPGYKLGLLELTGTAPLSASAWWKSASPVFKSANGAHGPGHNGFFTSPDGSEDWLVYHATTLPAGNCGNERTTRIQRFGWLPDGKPDFGTPLALGRDIEVPAGE